MGLLASMVVPAGALTQLYACPAGVDVSANLNICNFGAASCTVRVAVTTGGVPTDASWIEYGCTLPPGAPPIERTGIHLEPGHTIYVYASTATVAANLIGPRATI